MCLVEQPYTLDKQYEVIKKIGTIKNPEERARINKRCIIHTESGETYKICASISELKGKLGPSFYQTHQSCLVNVEKIK